jgi:predicted ArsR family transcriptional regulator
MTVVTVEHVEVKEVPLAEAKSAVEAYLKKVFRRKKQVYPSDVADALGLEYEVVREVFAALEKEGKIVESR